MSLLLVDSYDSFTFNLKNLIETSTNAHTITIHNDSYILPKDSDDLDALINNVDAIVIGPGPGSPENKEDIGIIPYIYQNYPQKPILGICLGFQTLCLHNGCSMGYLKDPIHGQVHEIEVVDQTDLFKGFPNTFESVRYHSIFINTPQDPESSIKPLAFYSDNGQHTMMAAKHISKPHFGVQYHPESICSTWGEQLIKNFWAFCNVEHEGSDKALRKDGHVVRNTPYIDSFKPAFEFDYQFKKLCINPDLTVLDICDKIKGLNNNVLLLNSAFAPGMWSIIGLPIAAESDVITHSTESPKNVILSKWKSDNTSITENIDDIFKYIANYMSQRYYEPTIEDPVLNSCPFVGGLVGYISYEEGQYIQHEKLKKLTKSNIDDTKLCFVERFIAINQDHEAFIVSIRKNDCKFISELHSTLSSLKTSTISSDINLADVTICTPNKEQYFGAFKKAQSYFKSGDSYELCLTCPTTLHFPKENETSSWDLYKALVKRNPSPYSAFLDFQTSNLLSTSPERFISWNPDSCQMRPIKGTLKKTPGIDIKEATKRLKIPKEMGENLMIVDLIRHDLFTLLEKVTVEKLMTVEEYKTIYQLVSVIDGYFDKSLKFKGIDVLAHCLPPGSMTGAPKKRSVELLHDLEAHERRGLYSGVCGYYSVNDFADWSVIIRSLFSYGDDLLNTNGERVYRCGAGGALTILSTDEGEWDEMFVKFDSVLQLFK